MTNNNILTEQEIEFIKAVTKDGQQCCCRENETPEQYLRGCEYMDTIDMKTMIEEYGYTKNQVRGFISSLIVKKLAYEDEQEYRMAKKASCLAYNVEMED